MLGRLNHVALAVPDLGKAAATYRDTLGAAVAQDLLGQGADAILARLSEPAAS